MATIPPLRLSRSQLAQFLKDQEQIRAFENLFRVVEPLADGSASSDLVEIGLAQASANEALSTIASVAQEAAVSCALVENKANQALALVGDLASTVEGLQMQPPIPPRKRQRFGQFWDTTTQTAAAINTAYAVTYNSSSITSADPDFEDVSLLLHMDGPNGSTTFTDSSIAPKSVTAFGGAQISTAQSKFGGASGFFDGVDDYIGASDAALALGSSDFTVEGWVRLNSVPAIISSSRLVGGGANNYWVFSVLASGALEFQSRNTAGTQFYARTGAGACSVGAWHHVAATRQSGLLRVFVDGALGATTANDAGHNLSEQSVALALFNYTGFVAFGNGYIDEVRITKGAARYTAGFTPPTAPFPDGAYSSALNQGVVLRNPSEVQVDTEGVYNFQFSVQLDKTSGGSANFWTWWRVNGVNVPASASQIQIQGNNHEIFGAANILLDLKAGDYVQLMWAVSDTTVQLQYFPASGPVPEIPSVILTVTSNIRSEP
jgi:hypothetical protein